MAIKFTTKIPRIKLRCQCGKRLILMGDFAGLGGQCPICQTPMQVPTAAQLLQHKAAMEARTQAMGKMSPTLKMPRQNPDSDESADSGADTAVIHPSEIPSIPIHDPMEHIDMEADTAELDSDFSLLDLEEETADLDEIPDKN